MVFIEQPKTEGEKKDCPSCGMKLVARLKVYKDYDDKIQWQNEKETKAHYDKDGNCNGTTTNGPTETLSTSIKSTTTVESKPSLELLDKSTKNMIKNEATLMYHVRREVESAIKEYEDNPNGGMIWEMAHAIWLKYFGDKE